MKWLRNLLCPNRIILLEFSRKSQLVIRAFLDEETSKRYQKLMEDDGFVTKETHIVLLKNNKGD